MNFSKLVPSVFYIDISDGLQLFVDCLQFSMEHQDLVASQPYCVLEKNGIRIMVFQDEQLAREHYPELRLETEKRPKPLRVAKRFLNSFNTYSFTTWFLSFFKGTNIYINFQFVLRIIWLKGYFLVK